MKSPAYKPIDCLLIANRGEIARRIIRSCREMGIRSVAVYSDADTHAPHVREADQAIHIGPSPAVDSYLDGEKLIKAAQQAGAQAIHPGYGFLSERAAFAEQCAAAGLIFIGPRPEAIRAMGSKSQAKALMIAHQVPTIPGYQGAEQDAARIKAAALEIGLPVLLKAAAGGGGKGMRIVRKEAELTEAIEGARREAQASFGDAELIVERYVAQGRHIEFQIVGDQHGKIIHVLERECSLQRRYQKVIEESPSPIMGPELRARMGEAAVKAAQALQYDNAGTVEFIYDEAADAFYFLEINTRLQVEHPVTEAITGLDLVQIQIEIAQGLPLSLEQDDIKANGYAIECRLYAEDPARDYLPQSGTVHHFWAPEIKGFRLDTAVETGSEVTIYYDPMLAKLIVHGRDRAEAHRKMRYVLQQLRCLGLPTNQAFLSALIAHPAFQAGTYDTRFLAREFADWTGEAPATAHQEAAWAACLHAWWKRNQQRKLLRSLPSGWRNNFYAPQQTTFQIGDKRHIVSYRLQDDVFSLDTDAGTVEIGLAQVGPDVIRLDIGGHQRQFFLHWEGLNCFVHHPEAGPISLLQLPRLPIPEREDQQKGYLAPMPAEVVKVMVAAGQTVEAGTPLLVLSSMKMENTLVAQAAGTVEAVLVQPGQHIGAGTMLLHFTALES